ncbi:TetR family transcriptional regulator [Nocardia sp. R16R-3T]
MPAEPAASAKARIARAARYLLLESGFTKMSYTKIADASGVDRPLVQYHFPRKEIFLLDFLDDLLAATRDHVRSHYPELTDPLSTLYVIGQLHFGTILLEDRIRLVTLDIVKNRELTARIIRFNEQWVASFLGSEELSAAESLSDDVTLILGGMYELVYRYTSEGNSLDVAGLMLRVVSVFGSSVRDVPPNVVRATLTSHAIPENELKRFCRELLGRAIA